MCIRDRYDPLGLGDPQKTCIFRGFGAAVNHRSVAAITSNTIITSKSFVDVPLGFLDVARTQKLSVGAAQLAVVVQRLLSHDVCTACPDFATI